MPHPAPILACLALALAVPQAPARAEDFTFRRVRAPAPGATGPRIDVQIDAATFLAQSAPRAPGTPRAPSAPEARGTVSRGPAGPGPASDAQAWFWDAVSPGLGAVPGRFTLAAATAARPPAGSGVAAPALDALQAIARAHGRDILARTVGTRVSPALVLALIAVESAGRTDALSPKGASGLMQLIPATAERFGVLDARDPGQNIRGGVAYLDWLMAEFGGDPILALAGYNAGEGAVTRHGGVPPYAETRTYVPRVMAAWNVARLMCRTPPELPGDGCVFDPALVGS